LAQPSQQAIVIDTVKELCQVKIDHPILAFSQMLASLSNRRVTAMLWAKSMAGRVKGRIVVRAHYLKRRLGYEPIDHVGNSKASDTPARLGYPHTADEPGSIAASEQILPQSRQDGVDAFTHIVHTLPVWARCSLVGIDSLESVAQVLVRRYFE
jgi:hypothetical protein